MKIYHNPRCQKSREGLAILEASGKEFKVINYLEDVPTNLEIKEILKLLRIAAIDLVRKNETVWKENYKNKTLSEDDIIAALVEHPKLIERPIIIHKNKAIIGRPPDLIKTII